MRIRQVKPAFFTDATIQKRLTDAERLIYIGLWLLADDAGWFRVDPEEIGAALRPFEPVEERESFVRTTLDHLADLSRIELAACGHGLIPTLIRHQRFAGPGKRVYVVREEHDGCQERPAESRGVPRKSAGNGTERKGTEQEREWRTDDPFEEIESLIKTKWGWQSVTSSQRAVISEVADRMRNGLDGVRNMLEIGEGDDPIAMVLEFDRALKAEGRRRADEQEAESARWRSSEAARSRSEPTRVGELLKRAVSRAD